MKPPKTPQEFDYYLWSCEGKYFVRLKSTGECCEVSKEVMQELRKDEYQIRNWYKQKKTSMKQNSGSQAKIITLEFLSLDHPKMIHMPSLDEKLDKIVIIRCLEHEFYETLTKRQKSVYLNCLKAGYSYVEYAKTHGITEGPVRRTVERIRRKAEKFFY